MTLKGKLLVPRYVPYGAPPDLPESVRTYLQDEYARIFNNLTSGFLNISGFVLAELDVEPDKIEEGLTVLVGSTWGTTLGSGPGVYTYYGGSWHKLG